MGIEPFLFLAVFIGGFLLQAGLAVREAVRRRLRAQRWMRHLLARTAAQLGWERDDRGYRGVYGEVSLRAEQGARRRLQRAVEERTGVRPPAVRQLEGPTHTVFTLTLPPGDRPRFTATAAGDESRRTVAIGDVVFDQLIDVDCDDREATRALLGHERVRGPLLELLGRHPQSVVTQSEVVLWSSGTVRDLEPALRLAHEVARQLAQLERRADPVARVSTSFPREAGIG
jgi:hypothetical protein